MNCTVDTRASTATRLQRAVWIGTIFRTCGRSREESITCGDQGMDVWGYGGDTQPNFEFAHLLNETQVNTQRELAQLSSGGDSRCKQWKENTDSN